MYFANFFDAKPLKAFLSRDTFSILVGIKGTKNLGVLDSAPTDAIRMNYFLQELGFDPGLTNLLVDAKAGSEWYARMTEEAGYGVVPNAPSPTKENIIRLLEEARYYPEIFFFFAGHGEQVADDNDDESDRLDEAILGSDESLGLNHMIRDDFFVDYLNSLSSDQRVLMVFDSCHSDSIVDLSRLGPDGPQVLQLGACLDHLKTSENLARPQAPVEISEYHLVAGGELTNAFLENWDMDQSFADNIDFIRENMDQEIGANWANLDPREFRLC